MNRWSALFRASRPLNLLIMAYTLAAMSYGIASPGVKQYTLHYSPMFFSVALLILSIILLGAGGNIINDFFDVDVDEANNDNHNQVGKSMGYGWTLMAYRILTGLGILLGAFLAFLYDTPILIFIHLFIAGSLWVYSKTWKRQYLMGNVVIGILTALLPFIALVFTAHGSFYAIGFHPPPELRLQSFFNYNLLIAAYCLFAFLTTLTRELIKDAEDIDGDRKTGCNTFAVAHGIEVSRKTSLVLMGVIIMLSVCFCGYVDRRIAHHIAIAIGVALIPIECAVLYILWQHKKRPNYLREASGLLKLLMFCGITTAWFFILC